MSKLSACAHEALPCNHIRAKKAYNVWAHYGAMILTNQTLGSDIIGHGTDRSVWVHPTNIVQVTTWACIIILMQFGNPLCVTQITRFWLCYFNHVWLYKEDSWNRMAKLFSPKTPVHYSILKLQHWIADDSFTSHSPSKTTLWFFSEWTQLCIG